LTSFGEVGFQDHGEDSTNSDLIDLQDPGIAPFHATRPWPIFERHQEELGSDEETGIPEASEPDDDDEDREEEESGEAPDESAVPKGMETDRGDPDDRGSEPDILSFLTNYSTRSMEQDADVSRENVDSTVMNSLIDLCSCCLRGEEMAEDVAP
jgi:hypothetical protein